MLAETIISAGRERPGLISQTGVELRTFASEECGATSFSTGLAIFEPGGYIPYHLHTFSEAVTILEGTARVLIEGRTYLLRARDCMHVPAGTAHRVENPDPEIPLVAHWTLANARPSRTFVEKLFPVEDRGYSLSRKDDPEYILHFDDCAVYELSEDAFFSDFFSKRSGAEGVCGGYGRFCPGSSLPCHTHDFDESITIIQGTATCLVEGRVYELGKYDTAFIQRGTPHRFINHTDSDMAMIWIYSGNEPDRLLVDARFCTGKLRWRGAKRATLHSL